MLNLRPKTFDEAEGDLLRAKQISTIDDLWAAVGENFDSGIATVAADTGVSEAKIKEVLTCQEKTVIGRAVPTSHGWQRFWFLVTDYLLIRRRARRFLKEHTPEFIALLVLVLATVLGVRAFRAERRALVATRNIEAGRTISAEDFTTAPLTPAGAYFDADNPPTGLIAAEPIGRGQMLRHSDMSRLQLTAIKDIAAGAKIEDDAVGLSWTRFANNALLQPGTAVGKRALRPIKTGDVVFVQDVGP